VLLGLGDGAPPPWPVRCAGASLHAVAAYLFFVRTPAPDAVSWRSLARSVPSLVLSGVAFRLGAARLEGPTLALFVFGALGACASLLTLGRSFAIFAARRALVARGPYALVRHPAYACELGMVAASAAALGSLDLEDRVLGLPRAIVAAAIFALTAAAVAVRIEEEERSLTDPAYLDYARRVPARLIPFVW
jgi:protein-S-isoprenylcysteine O-methyltransferase Ste14